MPWFSDTGRADTGCGVGGVVRRGVAVGAVVVGRRTEGSWEVFAGAGGEFAGAVGKFAGAAGEFDGAAGSVGT